jgi:hypothetical protein
VKVTGGPGKITESFIAASGEAQIQVTVTLNRE